MIAKGVPRMVIGPPGLQNCIYNHVLTISYVCMHHIGSLKRAKVLPISKVGEITINFVKIVQNLIKI